MSVDKTNRDLVPGGDLTPAEMDYYQSQAGPGAEEIDLSRIWSVILRRKWLMLAVFVVVVVPGVIYTKLQQPMYEATAMMVVPTSRPVSGSPEDMGLLSDLVALAKSRSVEGINQVLGSPTLIYDASQILGRDGLESGYGEEIADRGMVPPWALSFGMKKGSDVITVTAKAYDPEVAAELANTVITNYIDHERGYTVETARQGREFVAEELESVRKQLAEAQKELSEFKRKTRLITADDQVRQLVSNSLALQADRDRAEVELASAKSRTAELQSQLKADGEEIQSSSSIQMSPEYQQAIASLGRLHVERAKLIQEYVPESKEIVKVDAEIEEVKKHMKTVAETVVAGSTLSRNPVIDRYLVSLVDDASAEVRSRELGRLIAQREGEITELPDQSRTFADLERSVRVLESTFQMLSSKYYAMLINENSTLPNAMFAATARAPLYPASPNKRRNAALFALLGFILAGASAVVAERVDKRVRYEDTVSNLMGQLPLAVIPDVKVVRGSIFHPDAAIPGSGFMESFRMLRNAIRFSDEASQLRTLAITSPARAEGKSTTVVNLATAMAMTGEKVLIVDCDLRRPSLRDCIGVTHSLGFTDLVMGTATPEEAIFSTKVKNIDCLASGKLPDNPSEVLNSPQSRKLFASFAEKYDVVILDCPPCAGLSDMQVISTIADGVILVVSINQTESPALKNSLDILRQVNTPIIGSVINRFNTNSNGYYCGYDMDDSPKGGGIRGKLKGMLQRKDRA